MWLNVLVPFRLSFLSYIWSSAADFAAITCGHLERLCSGTVLGDDGCSRLDVLSWTRIKVEKVDLLINGHFWVRGGRLLGACGTLCAFIHHEDLDLQPREGGRALA